MRGCLDKHVSVRPVEAIGLANIESLQLIMVLAFLTSYSKLALSIAAL
jgi:hypothetical protein